MTESQEPQFESTLFVDRETQRATFNGLLNAKRRSHLPVLSFYGVGGVGKSWLQEQLRDILNQRNADSKAKAKARGQAEADAEFISSAKVDIGKWDTPDTYLEFLHRIVDALDPTGNQYPQFWKAWHFYAELNNEKNRNQKTSLSLYKPQPPRWTDFIASGTTMFYALVGSPWLKEHFNLQNSVLFAAFAYFLYTLTGAVIKKLDEKGMLPKPKYHKTYKAKTLAELEKELPNAFDADLKKLARSSHYHCHSVIFFDTLEKKITPLDDDVTVYHEWIARFARQFIHTLVVVTGHNRLYWRDLSVKGWDWTQEKHFDGTEPDIAWKESMNWSTVRLLQYRLLDLKKVDALDLLRLRGITDEAIHEVVLRECREESRKIQAGDDSEEYEGYHAQSLNLCVETLEQMPWASAKDFKLKGEHETIVGRYLKSLHPDDWLLAKQLAFTPQFDVDAAVAICQITPYSPSWLRLKSRNFVLKVTCGVPGTWRIFNSNMRRHILVSAPPTEASTTNPLNPDDYNAQSLNQRWYEHWKARHQGLSGKGRKKSKTPPDPTHLFARLAWSHLWHLAPADAWQQWKALAEPLRASQHAPENREIEKLLRWWDMTDIRERTPSDEAGAERVLELALIYWSKGADVSSTRLRRSLECCDCALRFLQQNAHEDLWIHAQNLKGANHAQIGKSPNLRTEERIRNLETAIACCELTTRAYQGNDLKEWATSQHNKGLAHAEFSRLVSSSEKSLQQSTKAIQCFANALTSRTKKEEASKWASTQHSKGVAHHGLSQLVQKLEQAEQLNQLVQSIQCQNLALEVYTEVGSPEDWAFALHCKGIAHSSMSRLEEELSKAERHENLKQSLKCFQSALRVYTPDRHTSEWADTQFYKGCAEWMLNDLIAALTSIGSARDGYHLIGDQFRWRTAQDLCEAIEARRPLA